MNFITLREKADILSTLDRIKEEITAGEIVEFLILTKNRARETEVSMSGSENSHATAGELLELACCRLGFAWRASVQVDTQQDS